MASDFVTNYRGAKSRNSKKVTYDSMVSRGDIQKSKSRDKYRVVDPKDLARFYNDWIMPLMFGMYKMNVPNYNPGNKGSNASVKGMSQLNETYNIIKAIREGAEMAAAKRAFDNADVKIIDRRPRPDINLTLPEYIDPLEWK